MTAKTKHRRACAVCGTKFPCFPSASTKTCGKECSGIRIKQLASKRPKRTATVVQCAECGTDYETTPSLVARGKKWCSWECYLVARDRANAVAKSQRQCRWCERTDVNAWGLCNACGQHYYKLLHPERWKSKTCQVCGCIFVTTHDRTYCTNKCWTQSSAFARCRADYSARMEAARIASECLQCGKLLLLPYHLTERQEYADGKRRSPKRFCNKICWRRHFAERFDRWFADPQTLALPQGYDEFLTQAELPCLVDGCEWSGKNLSIHANHCHGITADQLKELAGFNRNTGVVCPSTALALSERGVGRQAGDTTIVAHNPAAVAASAAPRSPLRLEWREHHEKAMAIYRATRKPKGSAGVAARSAD